MTTTIIILSIAVIVMLFLIRNLYDNIKVLQTDIRLLENTNMYSIKASNLIQDRLIRKGYGDLLEFRKDNISTSEAILLINSDTNLKQLIKFLKLRCQNFNDFGSLEPEYIYRIREYAVSQAKNKESFNKQDEFLDEIPEDMPIN